MHYSAGESKECPNLPQRQDWWQTQLGIGQNCIEGCHTVHSGWDAHTDDGEGGQRGGHPREHSERPMHPTLLHTQRVST